MTTLRRLFFRLLHVWFLLSRGLTLGVRGAAIDAEGRVLLIRHTYQDGWHLPGGGVEIGETTEDALAREMREEGAIEILGRPRLLGLVYNDTASRRDHVAVYEVREFRVMEAKRPDWEIAEAAFFSLDALPDGVTEGTRRRLDELRSASPAAPRW